MLQYTVGYIQELSNITFQKLWPCYAQFIL